MVVADVRDVHRAFPPDVKALRGVSLTVAPRELVAVLGPSGCGKTTLLNLVAGIDEPTSGQVLVDGADLGTMNHDERARFRGRHIGYVLQGFALLPELTAAENVELPAVIAGVPARQRQARVDVLLELVGIKHRAYHPPPVLSGGEQQRVAIARALYFEPSLVLADEPTGNLDVASGMAVIELLGTVRASGASVLMVTHDHSLAARADRVVMVRDGLVVGALDLRGSKRRKAESLHRWASQLAEG